VIKLTHTALGGTLAAVAILAQLVIAASSRAENIRLEQEHWKADIDQRLVRVETKLDRLLNVTTAALESGRRLPR